MPIHTLQREQFIPRPLAEVFQFFADAWNLERITPAFLRFYVLTPSPIDIKRGTVLDYRLKWHGFPLRWRTKIIEWTPPHCFVDLQIKGPYKLWRHAHNFQAIAGGTRMTDSVSYELSLGLVGAAAHALLVQREVESIFDYRRDRITELFRPD